jgi:hypothetical protein
MKTTPKREQGARLRWSGWTLAALVALGSTLAFGPGCSSTGSGSSTVSGSMYYGVGFADPWFYGSYYYPPAVIVPPPPPMRPPPIQRPPVASPPIVRPTPMPSIPARPMPRGR